MSAAKGRTTKRYWINGKPRKGEDWLAEMHRMFESFEANEENKSMNVRLVLKKKDGSEHVLSNLSTK